MAGGGLWGFGLVGVAVLVTFSLFAATVFVPGLAVPSSPPTTTGTAWDFGGGLATMSDVQNVTGERSWVQYCASAEAEAHCGIAEGIVYVPSLDLMVLTEVQDNAAGCGCSNVVEEFNPDTLGVVHVLPLTCYPEDPFYPGRGVTVYVPCLNATTYTDGVLLVMNAATGTLDANITMPVSTLSMTYDSKNGLLYVAASSNAVVAIDPTNDSIVSVRNVTAASFAFGLFNGQYRLVYDAASDTLVAPSTSDGLVSFVPTTGALVRSLALPGTPLSLAIDPATDQLFAATTPAETSGAPGHVEVFNGATFALEANLSISPCFLEYGCGTASVLAQPLFDPAHGDVYFASSMALITVNLSTLVPVSAVEDYGDGEPTGAAYAPGTDRVFVTYEYAGGPAPGGLIQLTHDAYATLTSLLWVPASEGILALGLVVGTVLVIVYRLRRRPSPSRVGPRRP